MPCTFFVAYYKGGMSAFSAPSKICAIGGTYYDVSGVAIPAAPVTSPTLVTPNIGVATATSINGMAMTSDSTTYTVACRDTNANIAANAYVPGVTSTATAASTTTLMVGSTQVQIFTGSTTQTLVLPAATTLRLGHYYRVINKSSGAVTVNANGGGLVGTVSASTGTNFIATNISTAAGTWIVDAGGTASNGDAVLASTQTFSGVNTFSNATAASSATTGAVAVTGGIGVSGGIVGGTSSTLSLGNNAAAVTSAIVDLNSTSRGILPPRMTTTQRDAISSPATGLLLYNTTSSSLNVYDGVWRPVGAAAICLFTMTGNASIGTWAPGSWADTRCRLAVVYNYASTDYPLSTTTYTNDTITIQKAGLYQFTISGGGNGACTSSNMPTFTIVKNGSVVNCTTIGGGQCGGQSLVSTYLLAVNDTVGVNMRISSSRAFISVAGWDEASTTQFLVQRIA